MSAKLITLPRLQRFLTKLRDVFVDQTDVITTERINQILASNGGSVQIVTSEMNDVLAAVQQILPQSVLSFVFDAIYPVGSYYFSDYPTSPAELFGGTWEPITDKFILAAGSVYAAGTSGGNATHSHLYGIRFGAYFREILLESNPNAGVLQYGDPTLPVKPTVISDGAATVEVNNNAAGSSKSLSVSHLQSITDTSIESTLPPYTVVYVWHRVPD